MAGPLAPLVPLAVIGGKVARRVLSRAKEVDKKAGKLTKIDEGPGLHREALLLTGAAGLGAATRPKKPKKRAKRNASLTAGLPKSKSKKAKPPGLIKNRKASSIVRRKK